MMYEEIIKELRDATGWKNASAHYSLMNRAADAIECLNSQIANEYNVHKAIHRNLSARIPRWIPVTERLPENEVEVLVVRRFLGDTYCPPNTYVETAKYCYGDWVADSDEYKIARCLHTDPLYWMPLPAPPAIDADKQP